MRNSIFAKLVGVTFIDPNGVERFLDGERRVGAMDIHVGDKVTIGLRDSLRYTEVTEVFVTGVFKGTKTKGGQEFFEIEVTSGLERIRWYNARYVTWIEKEK